MYAVIMTLATILSTSAFVVLFAKTGYLSKALFKLGWGEEKDRINWTAFSWESCLRKMESKADVVFFGDSIIRGGDFQKAFPNSKVINLGSSGDTLRGMLNRVSMVQAVSPDKVFFLGGINGLTNYNIERCVKQYDALIETLQSKVPYAQIYVHSVLPLSVEKEKHICKNETIVTFNREIQTIAERRGVSFIDLHALYVLDGKMNPEMTCDGLHLQPEAYTPWILLLERYLDSTKADTKA